MQSFELFRAERRDVAFYSYATIILDFGTLLDVNILYLKYIFLATLVFLLSRQWYLGRLKRIEIFY